jgi:hypothetical protein
VKLGCKIGVSVILLKKMYWLRIMISGDVSVLKNGRKLRNVRKS